MTLTAGQLLFVALAWALVLVEGGVMFGLWWGERGRRRALEHQLVFGAPDGEAPKAVSLAPAKEAEDRFREAAHEVSEATVRRAVKDLKVMLKARGQEIGEKELERDVRMMFAGQDVM